MSSTTPPPAARTGGGNPAPGDRIRPKKSARVQFASVTLLLEAFVLLFATLVAYGLRSVPEVWPGGAAPPAATIWWAGGVFVVVLVVLSRMVGSPGGYVAGSLVQIPVLATGFAIPMMVVVGGTFAVLWVVSLRLGGRIDRERAAYDAEHPETAPNA